VFNRIHLSRRDAIAGLATSALAAPHVARAQAKTLAWVTHPAILGATGDGELLRRFRDATGIIVEPTTFPTEALGPRIQAEFIARSPAFDVVSMADAFWTSALARFVEPLDAHIKTAPPPGGLADFSPGMVQQFRVPQTASGAIMGIPQRVSVSLLYYRRDLFEAAGIVVPTHFDDYLAACRRLTREGMSGSVFQGMQGQAGVLDWYEFASPQGADLLVGPEWKKAAFNSPAGVKALEQRRRMIVDGLVNPGVASYGFDDAINAVAQGKAASSLLFSAYWPRFEDPKTSQVAGRIGYAPIMREPGVNLAYPARGWSLSINKVSARKEMAWEFIRFLTDAPQQLWMAVNKGNPVSRISVAKSAELAKAVPIAGALAAALPFAKIMPNSAALPRVYDALSSQLGAALAGSKSAKDALASAETTTNAILA
jgi:multiple sugar transport system substrate-binding protein